MSIVLRTFKPKVPILECEEPKFWEVTQNQNVSQKSKCLRSTLLVCVAPGNRISVKYHLAAQCVNEYQGVPESAREGMHGILLCVKQKAAKYRAGVVAWVRGVPKFRNASLSAQNRHLLYRRRSVTAAGAGRIKSWKGE